MTRSAAMLAVSAARLSRMLLGAATALALLGVVAGAAPVEEPNRNGDPIGGPVGPLLRRAAQDTAGVQSVEELAGPPVLSKSALRDGQLAWRAAIRSLEVTFSHSDERRFFTPADERRRREGILPPEGSAFELEYARKGDRVFVKFRDTSKNPPRPNPKNPTNLKITTIRAFNGSRTTSYTPLMSVGTYHPGKLVGLEANAIFYLDFPALPRAVPGTEHEKTILYVPRALEMDEYRLAGRMQAVDGHPCHVVSNGHDTLWIDHAHGFCVRRRVWIYDGLKPGQKYLQYAYVSKDFKKCAAGPDVWLPRECYAYTYPTLGDPVAMRNRIYKIDFVRASSVSINEVKDSRFDIALPPGTQVHDLVGNIAYNIPHGEGALDDAVRNALPIVNGRIVTRGLSGGPGALAWSVAGVGAILTAWMLFRIATQPRRVGGIDPPPA